MRLSRKKHRKWYWKEMQIEEAKSFTYLGYAFNKTENNKDYISNVVRKGMIATRQVCK